MRQNVPLLFAIGALSWMRFFIPVLALFYIASQVPLDQFAIIMSVFALVTLMLEVPSGVVADLIGKNKTLVLANACYVVEVVILAFSDGFWPLLIAKAISGVGVSLSSGASEALLYDTLKRQHRAHEHKRLSGLKHLLTSISMGVTFLIGGVLFAIDPKLPAQAAIPPMALALVLSCFLAEPYPKRNVGARRSLRHLSQSIRHFWQDADVRYLTLFSLPIAAAISISLSMSSAYLERVAVPVALIGTVALATSLLTGFTARHAHGLEQRLGVRRTLRLLQELILVALLTMALMIPYWGVLFYLLIAIAWGLQQVLVNHYLNERLPSSHRTTILSIRNMGDNIGVFLLFPLVGMVAKESVGKAFFLLAMVFLGYALALAWYRRMLHRQATPLKRRAGSGRTQG